MGNLMKRHRKFNLNKSTKLSSAPAGLEERQEHLCNSCFFKEILWGEGRSSHIITLKAELRLVRWLVEAAVRAKRNRPLTSWLIAERSSHHLPALWNGGDLHFGTYPTSYGQLAAQVSVCRCCSYPTWKPPGLSVTAPTAPLVTTPLGCRLLQNSSSLLYLTIMTSQSPSIRTSLPLEALNTSSSFCRNSMLGGSGASLGSQLSKPQWQCQGGQLLRR